MSEKELQEEEREALSSIYDGDDLFKEIDESTYQYKYGENNTNKSFVLEIKWGELYPNELPVINMDTFYNKHIVTHVKQKVVETLSNEAEQYLGMSMTYSLFEFLREKFEELINEQPDEPEKMGIEKLCISETEQQGTFKKERKEQLTKAQKRRQWNRMDAKGEKPRGWNWVDIVKHLSQTGSKDEQPIS
ncbi:RWD domain-containing protein 4 isoform X2 [Diorhabda sublineata]|uniref:RWD domain-containing protein 4 isoform X2 n=1 Tax=Diorhabda sublineata TaxID=1163346 RepID=UPI0024E10C26|nr:RWD domain-containing protein 4 isoform X2 [Diorhabda sublineata]